MSEPAEERICAFVDILGFKELVRAIPDAISFQKVIKILREVHWIPAGFSNSREGIDFQAQNMSDTIVLSTTVSVDGLIQIADVLENLALELLKEGYFIRGAIVRGQLYHDKQVIFGRALIDAYQLESEVVRFPRVMLARRVVEIANTDNMFWERSVRQSEDGPFFLHILRKLEFTLWPDFQNREITGFLVDNTGTSFGAIRDMVQRRFNEAVDNPRHFEKVKWFAQYWNRSRPAVLPASLRIVGPGLV